jgi:hypothetical protein
MQSMNVVGRRLLFVGPLVIGSAGTTFLQESTYHRLQDLELRVARLETKHLSTEREKNHSRTIIGFGSLLSVVSSQVPSQSKHYMFKFLFTFISLMFF